MIRELATCFVAIGVLSAGIRALAQPLFRTLGDLPGGFEWSEAWDISSDGRCVVGTSNSSSGNTGYEAFRWTLETGMVGLGGLPTRPDTQGLAVSADGSTVAGWAREGIDRTTPFRWTLSDGMTDLGNLTGDGGYAYARDVSDDGSTVVGTTSVPGGREAFRWTAATGMVIVGPLPGDHHLSWAEGISADGSVIVGYGSHDTPKMAFGGLLFAGRPRAAPRRWSSRLESWAAGPRRFPTTAK